MFLAEFLAEYETSVNFGLPMSDRHTKQPPSITHWLQSHPYRPPAHHPIELPPCRLLNQDKATVKVYETADRWFGVTYLEDKPFVVDSIRGLIKDGVYPENLWA